MASQRKKVVNTEHDTKHGKPVTKLVPTDSETDEIFNFLVDKGVIEDDVVSPALSSEEWGDLE